MYSLQIVDSDAFLDMSAGAQLLYFHLGMRADDDGFVSNPKKIMRMIGANDDDLKVLLVKRFLLAFESGIVVIKHWKINNYIQNDRYTPTKYIEEKNGLTTKENGAYTDRIQDVSTLETQVRLGKDSKEKKSVAVATPSLPVREVADDSKKPRVPRDTRAMELREWCYKQIEQETGVRPITSQGDYVRLVEALKYLKETDIRDMMIEALDRGRGQTVRGVFTNRAIDVYRQENV